MPRSPTWSPSTCRRWPNCLPAEPSPFAKSISPPPRSWSFDRNPFSNGWRRREGAAEGMSADAFPPISKKWGKIPCFRFPSPAWNSFFARSTSRILPFPGMKKRSSSPAIWAAHSTCGPWTCPGPSPIPWPMPIRASAISRSIRKTASLSRALTGTETRTSTSTHCRWMEGSSIPCWRRRRRRSFLSPSCRRTAEGSTTPPVGEMPSIWTFAATIWRRETAKSCWSAGMRRCIWPPSAPGKPGLPGPNCSAIPISPALSKRERKGSPWRRTRRWVTGCPTSCTPGRTSSILSPIMRRNLPMWPVLTSKRGSFHPLSPSTESRPQGWSGIVPAGGCTWWRKKGWRTSCTPTPLPKSSWPRFRCP